ncbi:10 kDa chaperonin 1 chloroplastic [Bienertia sinuspersici]
MASTASFITLAKPFALPNNSHSSNSNQKLVGLRRNSLRINAVATKWEPTKVVPQADRVLIRLEELPEKSAGGVLLPKSAVKFERYLMGEILSVGSDVGEVEAGKKVLFSDISAYEVDLGADSRHCFCKESDLLALVE